MTACEREQSPGVASAVVDALAEAGLGLVTGVPCSHLASLINEAIVDPRLTYVGATGEGEAAAWAIGAWLGGSHAAVLCQNSGIGNLVNPVATLATPCQIPILVISSQRGLPGAGDEPQHAVMGAVTAKLLELIGVHTTRLHSDSDPIGGVRESLTRMQTRGGSQAVLIHPRELTSSGAQLPMQTSRPANFATPVVLGGPPQLSRREALIVMLEKVANDVAIVATTGYAGRDLFELGDRPQNFYVVGAMGCASAISAGAAKCSGRRVLVLDGDGAALMRLGNLATIGTEELPGLIHLLVDNEAHDSTGGQRTVSGKIDFAGIGAACGYRTVTSCAGADDLRASLDRALLEPGPHLVHLRALRRATPSLSRQSVHPADVAWRFREWMSRAPVPVS